jgi:hypothetical protein
VCNGCNWLVEGVVAPTVVSSTVAVAASKLVAVADG